MNFPNNPAINDVYTYGGKSWVWTGVVWKQTSANLILTGVNGGTGVANTGKTITLGGNLVTSGANSLTLTTTGATNITLPTSGTVMTTTGNTSGLAGSATNIAGGAANQIPVQTGSGATTFIVAPSTGSTYLQWTGSAFTWAAAGGTTTNAVTFNNSGSGAASGTTFNGASAQTISYNTVGALQGNAIMQGGRTYVTHDFSTYINLYEAKFINPTGSTSVPAGVSGNMYLFGMGAGDTASRGFELLGSSSTQLLFRERGTGTWMEVVSTTLAQTLTNKTLTSPQINAGTMGVAATVAAGTNAQGQGALTSDLNVVTTAASAPSGITLPTATVGRWVSIVNKGANAIKVYPASGGQIDALGANVATDLPVGAKLEFLASTTTQWHSSATGAKGNGILTLAGNLTTSGAFASTFTMTGTTSVTFPTSGTLMTTTGNTSGSAGSVVNAATFNNGGAGAASGTTFNGASAQTISYNTIGAPSTTGTNASGTWAISVTGNAATATTSTNIAGGAANQIHVQTGAGATTFIAAPTTSSTYLQWTGSAFTWAAASGGGGTTTNAVTFNNGGAGAVSGTTFNGASAQTISYNTIGAPSTTGTGASGTWGISITGNAATVTNLSLASTLTTSGANALTLTTTGATNVTLPTSGTLATLGANTYTGAQVFGSGVVFNGNANGAWTASNLITGLVWSATGIGTNVGMAWISKGSSGYSFAGPSNAHLRIGGGIGATPSNNFITIDGAATGAAPTIGSGGGTDTNVNLNLAPQGTGVVTVNSTPVALTSFVDSAPSSPVPGQLWTNGTTGITYTYLFDGTRSQWVESGSIPVSLTQFVDSAPPNPVAGQIWINGTTGVTYTYLFDGVNSQWVELNSLPPTGGAAGAAGNAVFYENDQVVTGSYAITTGRNAMSAGPISIVTGATVTIPTGSVWSIV